MAHTYNFKMLNGVKTTLTTPQKATYASRDAANWATGPVNAPPATMMARAATPTSTDKLALMARAFGMTVDELKDELAK